MTSVIDVTRLRHAGWPGGCLHRLLMAIGLIAWSLAAQAQVYSWQDETGQWHFADHPPAGGAERRAVDDLPALNTMRPPEPSPYRQLPRPPPASRPAVEGAMGSQNAPTPRCESLARRLEAVQQQLRSGYEEPRGNRLRARRRELTAAYRRECR